MLSSSIVDRWWCFVGRFFVYLNENLREVLENKPSPPRRGFTLCITHTTISPPCHFPYDIIKCAPTPFVIRSVMLPPQSKVLTVSNLPLYIRHLCSLWVVSVSTSCRPPSISLFISNKRKGDGGCKNSKELKRGMWKPAAFSVRILNLLALCVSNLGVLEGRKNRKIPISIGWNSPRPLRFRLQFALVWSSLQSTVEPSLSTKFNIDFQNVTSSQVDLLDLGCVFSSTFS